MKSALTLLIKGIPALILLVSAVSCTSDNKASEYDNTEVSELNLTDVDTAVALDFLNDKLEFLTTERSHMRDNIDSLFKLGVVTNDSRAMLMEDYLNVKSEKDRAFLKEKVELNELYGEHFDKLCEIDLEYIKEIVKTEEAKELLEHGLKDGNGNYIYTKEDLFFLKEQIKNAKQ